MPGFESIDAGSLRQLLTDGDIERYRTLDTDAAAAVERVCRDCFSTDTERAVVASLRGELARDGIETLVTLVGSEESAPEYRHFTPTETELGGYALVSVTAQCRRLHASLTHTVAFDPPD